MFLHFVESPLPQYLNCVVIQWPLARGQLLQVGVLLDVDVPPLRGGHAQDLDDFVVVEARRRTLPVDGLLRGDALPLAL